MRLSPAPRVVFGTTTYEFDDVPVLVPGRHDCLASGKVWYQYKIFSDEMGEYCDYRLTDFDGVEVFDENGDEVPVDGLLMKQITEYLYTFKDTNIRDEAFSDADHL